MIRVRDQFRSGGAGRGGGCGEGIKLDGDHPALASTEAVERTLCETLVDGKGMTEVEPRRSKLTLTAPGVDGMGAGKLVPN